MRGRKIAGDEWARVPFAMVAVLILMLSVMSMSYLGGIQRREAGIRLAGEETSRQQSVLHQLEKKMSLEAYYIASGAVAASTRYLCNQSMLDRCFQENYSKYLEEVFPLYEDPYLVEVRDFRQAVFLEELSLHDLVPSNRTNQSNISLDDGSGTMTNATVEVLDTVTTESSGETSALARYVVVGEGNCTVRNTRSNAAMESPISFQRTIDAPYPLMNSKAAILESSTDNNAMGMVRAVKYILTTVAQFRVLEGWGAGLAASPGPASGILSLSDVQLAVNIAVILETVRLFRDFDESVVLGIDSAGNGYAGNTIESLLQTYLNNGTLDPADIVAIYSGIGDRKIPADIILAQAFNAIIDQFILKYLDYFGITDIANGIYRTGQAMRQWIEDVGRSLSDFIWGDDGENRKGAEQVNRWLLKNSESLGWPPDPAAITVPGVIHGDSPAAGTDLAVLDVLQPIPTIYSYSGNCSQLTEQYSVPIIDADGQIVGASWHAAMCLYNISAATTPTHSSKYPAGYIANFRPASMLRQQTEVVALWSEFYTEFYSEREDVIYSTMRDAVKNVTYELSTLITSFMGQKSICLSEYSDGKYAIDPNDRASTLEDMRNMIAEIITETTDCLQENPGRVNSLLSVLTNRQSQLTVRLMEFISQNYDVLADSQTCQLNALESLSRALLLNSTMSVQPTGTASAVYSVYNELGKSRGYFDSPLPYDCLQIPDQVVCADVLGVQCRSQLALDIQPHADSAYSKLKLAESSWLYLGSAQNGLYIRALESTVASLSGNILSRFIGKDPSSFIGLAKGIVISVLDSIIWSGEVANTQYSPELLYSDEAGAIGFGMYEGEYSSAMAGGAVWEERFTVTQPDGPVMAIEANMVQSDVSPVRGTITVEISAPQGVHYTDAVTFNERPFENRWNVTIRGNIAIHAASGSYSYLGNGSQGPTILERILELDFVIPVTAYSGWNLVGIDYTGTNSLAGDVEKLLDIVGAFFDWVWDTIAAPINWLIDQVMKIVDFFADLVGKLLAYAQDVMNKVTELIGFLVEKVQIFLRDIADLIFNSIVDWIIDLLPDGSEFRFSLFGFDFIVAFAEDCEMDRIEMGYGGELLSVRTEGKLLGTGFDIGLELWSLSDNVSAEAGMEYDLLLDADIEMFGFTLDIAVDPFMVLRGHIVECRGEGNGWAMELNAPVAENIYATVGYSLHDIAGVGVALSNIPIPFLGLKASVNAGFEIKYTLRGLEEDNLVINEVELNPRGLDNGTQWVEIYNPLNANVSLGNWTLSYGSNSSYNITFNSSFSIKPFGYWMVQYFNRTLPTESVRFLLLDPGGAIVDATPPLSEPDNAMVNNISTGTSGCDATWQRAPNGANFSVAGKWNFTWGSIGAENPAVDIQFKPLVWALLKGAFNTTWHNLRDELALSLDFIVKLVTQFIQRFIEDVLRLVERSVVETCLFLDVKLTDATGSGGGGITLSFVIEGGDTLAALLRWVIGSVAVFMAKFGKPTQPSQYPKLGDDIPEHLFVRLEFYGLVRMPKVLQKASGNEEEPDQIKLIGRIEANIPALAALAGREMGRWRINFGVFIENVPPKIADPLFRTGDKTINVWLFKGTVWEK